MMKKSEAATIYIDPTCESSGDGTTTICGANGPFKTWAEVTWAAGSTYSQKGGTTVYETITIGASGTAENPIVINSYGTGKAKLNGVVAVSPAAWTGPDANGVYYMTANSYVLLLENDTFLEFSTTLANLGVNGNYFDSHLSGDGKNYYKPTDNFNPDTLYQVRGTGVQLGGNDYITIDNLDFSKYWFGIFSAPSIGDANTNITITNCDFSNSQQGIGLKAHNSNASDIKITNNTFDYIKSNIEFYEYTLNGNEINEFRNCEIDHNTITHSAQIYTPTGPAAYTWQEIDMSYGHGTNGLDLEGVGVQDLADSSIHDNSISGIAHGIIMYAGTYNKSYNNNIYNNNIKMTGTFAIGIGWEPAYNSQGFYDNTAHNNVIVSDGLGFRISNIENPIATYNHILNNTISYGVAVTGHGVCSNRSRPANAEYFEIKNNIFNGTGTAYDGAAIYFLYTDIHDHVLIDYNLFYPASGAAGSSRWYNDGYKNWSTWQSYAYDAHSLYATDERYDPDFSIGSYTIQSTSPAINAGTDVGLTSDFDGNPIVGTPDIGAYEYQGADVTAPTAPSGLSVD